MLFRVAVAGPSSAGGLLGVYEWLGPYGPYPVVQFQSLLGMGDGAQDRLTINTVLNVGCCSKLIAQHLLDSSDLHLQAMEY